MMKEEPGIIKLIIIKLIILIIIITEQKTIQLMDSEMEGADNELTGELVTMNSPRWNIGVIPTPSQGPLPLYVCNRNDLHSSSFIFIDIH